MKKPCLIAALLSMLIALLVQCRTDTLPAPEDSHSIVLRWVPGYEGESWEQVETGMLWSFSFLGATLPPGSMQQAITFIDDTHFKLELDQLGFRPQALRPLRVIIKRLKESGEYQSQGAVGLGRFLVLTLHTSWHYYEITAVPKTLAGFLERHELDSALAFPVLESTISRAHRMIRFKRPLYGGRLAFLAEESPEPLQQPGFAIEGYEAFDILPNGQLRFMIYDAQGQLAPAAPVATTLAGKPSKCLWCHETKVLPLFAPSPPVDGFMDSGQFRQLADSANQALATYREQLNSDLDFQEQPAHTESELLYITFMEPSARRVAREWNWPLEDVQLLLESHPTHTFPEFPFLGELYHRRLIDSLAPYATEAVPGSVREPNEEEPNYFK